MRHCEKWRASEQRKSSVCVCVCVCVCVEGLKSGKSGISLVDNGHVKVCVHTDRQTHAHAPLRFDRVRV